MVLPLDTAPGPSPDDEAVRNMEISHNFLLQAREELAKEDLLQASNKAWGAAAYAIKAVAEKRRWFNDADWKLWEAASVVTEEEGDHSILAGYSAARQAHYDFYHHEFLAMDVRQILDITEGMVAKLDALLERDIPPVYVSEELDGRIRRLQNPTSAMDQERLTTGRKPMSERPPALPPNSADTTRRDAENS
ncbi:MAG: hypothetical protein F4X65_09930 [Chloroflexi bacterium]|nr:hypothetical protein [Chloroflexota bacterium]